MRSLSPVSMCVSMARRLELPPAPMAASPSPASPADGRRSCSPLSVSSLYAARSRFRSAMPMRSMSSCSRRSTASWKRSRSAPPARAVPSPINLPVSKPLPARRSTRRSRWSLRISRCSLTNRRASPFSRRQPCREARRSGFRALTAATRKYSRTVFPCTAASPAAFRSFKCRRSIFGRWRSSKVRRRRSTAATPSPASSIWYRKHLPTSQSCLCLQMPPPPAGTTSAASSHRGASASV